MALGVFLIAGAMIFLNILSENYVTTIRDLPMYLANYLWFSKSSSPLEIIKMSVDSPNSPNLTYPFSDTNIKVELKSNTYAFVNEYYFQFYLDGAYYMDGEGMLSLAHGDTYEVPPSTFEAVISNIAEACKFSGLNAGQHNLLLKVTTDKKISLMTDMSGPTVSEKSIQFNLDSSCQKK